MPNFEQVHPIVHGGVGSPQPYDKEYIVAATNQTRAEGYHPIGTRGYLPDGRVFYYASNGAVALTPGILMVQTLHTRTANHDDITLTATGVVGIGASVIDLSETDKDTDDIITNEYADGWFWVNSSTGLGQYWKVLGHENLDSAGSADRKVALASEVNTALAATSTVNFARNSYDRLITSTTAEEEYVVGVASCVVTASDALATSTGTAEVATDTSFFWCQTWGPAAVLIGDTSAEARPVMSGTAASEVLAWDAGAQASATAVTLPVTRMQVGVNIGRAVADGDYQLVDLRIRP